MTSSTITSSPSPLHGSQPAGGSDSQQAVADDKLSPPYPYSLEPSQHSCQEDARQHQDLHMTQLRKWSLLLVFSLALFIDQWCLAAFYIFTTPIVDDLNVPFSQQSWVITSYAVTFAASLLFWGRLSDLYSAKQVFSYGFFSLGVISIVISFLPEKYSFFIFRAISGIAGGTSVPSAFRLIAGIFEPHELKKAFTLYGMAGAIAATTGNIVAGLLQLIQPTGQMAGWRWFFRLMAVLIIPVSIGSLKWIPKIRGHDADVKNKWERLDLIGSLSVLVAIVCIILALTLGATNGWGSAGFIAPLIISLFLFPFFIWHESRLPTTHALLPPHFWRYPNFTLWIVFALLIQGWFAVEQLPWIETFMSVKGESSLKASVRILPQPIMAVIVTILAARFPQMTARPRITVALGLGCAIGANLLFIYAKDYTGLGYWKYLLPGYIIGPGACMALFNMNNVGVMTTVPPESAGVAGAVIQVSVQLGNAIALGIQAGLFTVFPDGVYNFKNLQVSWWVELGWCGVWLIMFLAFYRNPKKQEVEDDMEKGKEKVVMGH
ncbi:hypothetical protein L198_06017 [Cryptococcus wingfieldii CBS 7118]|uniref:Major facilitator superfamily (MFS) profile domain-containing protein n=1 Tax=Cryptococcus wingfieldii CBS 7118 TaxID=1295528 RepID=A0A1E3ISL9_9TREE|nr:hypothetical protein L198_06017 [Cryptococcus wingfieldii CBS 7118]ODN90701.1 hypothetical protein L198_06017 [Cryptococcus wingfieldii CBS 7118]